MKPFIYTSNDFGAPQIYNIYGSLVKMLKTVLVDGFGDMTGVNVIKENENTLLLTTPSEYPIGIETILYFKNLIGHENTRFTVKELKPNNQIVVKNYDNVDLSYFDTPDLSLTITRKPLGYTLKYDNINTQGKAVFTSRNGWNLRVHDELPKENSLWNVGWAKGARISWGRDMTNIDTWAIRPKNYVSSRPDSWKQPHYIGTVSNTNLKISENAWYYSVGVAGSNYLYNVIDTNTTNPKNWTIIGTDTTFYIWISPTTSNIVSLAHCYGFGEFDTMVNNDVNNAFLISWNGINSSSFYNHNEIGTYHWSSYSYNNEDDTVFNSKSFQLASPYTQGTPFQPKHASCTWLMGGGLSALKSGFHNSFNIMNMDNATLLYSPIYIEEHPIILRGRFKGAHAILNDITTISKSNGEQSPYFTVDKFSSSNISDKRYIIKTQTYTNASSGTISVMFDMDEDWG